MIKLTDHYNRTHDFLRISLTDKCNLKCSYCTPAAHNGFSSNEILTFDELNRIVNIFVRHLGIKKIRFTGGEPLVRKNINEFFSMISETCRQNNVKLGITTNGLMLSDHLESLKAAGVELLNISLDSLKNAMFREITGYDKLNEVLNAIDKAYEMGFRPLKLNCVVMRNKNLSELNDFVSLVKDRSINVRFIEYMPFDKNGWNDNEYVSTDEMISSISCNFRINKTEQDIRSVSRDYKINDFKGIVSFISPMSHSFCTDCSRIRITPDGKFKSCLFTKNRDDLNIKWILRYGTFSDEEIAEIIHEHLIHKHLFHPGINELAELNKNNMISIGG